MSKYIPEQVLAAAQRGLWKVIRQVQYAEGDFGRGSAAAQDCEEVEKVLRIAAGEMAKIIRRKQEHDQNRRNVRQAEDFALKSQLAKARGAVVSALKDRQGGPSDK